MEQGSFTEVGGDADCAGISGRYIRLYYLTTYHLKNIIDNFYQ